MGTHRRRMIPTRTPRPNAQGFLALGDLHLDAVEVCLVVVLAELEKEVV